jgi:hypothetical protein
MIDRTTFMQEGNELKPREGKNEPPLRRLEPCIRFNKTAFYQLSRNFPMIFYFNFMCFDLETCLNKKTPTGKESYELFCRGGEI